MIRHTEMIIRGLRLLTALLLMAALPSGARPCGALPSVTLPAPGYDIALSDTITVYLLAGQSNAVGYNHIREYHGDTAELSRQLKGVTDILFWPGTNALPGTAGLWTGLRPGLAAIAADESYRNGCFGPEIGFALKLRESDPEGKIAIIKYAEGATGIARSSDYNDYIPALKGFDDKDNNWAPPEKGKPAGNLYTGLLENIRLALAGLEARNIPYRIGGFIWMQGEHEAGISPTMAGDYDKILSGFIRSVRNNLSDNDMPFLIGEINSHTWAFGDLARKRQAAVCSDDPLSVLVKTTDLPRKGVGNLAHFDADGMLELGKRFGSAARQMDTRLVRQPH